jgi:hypothetical protein
LASSVVIADAFASAIPLACTTVEVIDFFFLCPVKKSWLSLLSVVVNGLEETRVAKLVRSERETERKRKRERELLSFGPCWETEWLLRTKLSKQHEFGT